jgi:hypothetical protein
MLGCLAAAFSFTQQQHVQQLRLELTYRYYGTAVPVARSIYNSLDLIVPLVGIPTTAPPTTVASYYYLPVRYSYST